MFFFSVCLFLSLAAAKSCGLRKLENLVTFGDSLTDDGRANYFFDNGDLPPPGMDVPIVPVAASGGASWGRIATNATGAHYNNYAVQGATCDADLVERYFEGAGAPFPSVLDYEISTFRADLDFENLYPNRQPDNTAYVVWIGPNDLGQGGYLTDSQAPGATLSNVTDCFWEVFDNIYATGGRYFVILTVMPADQFPLYKSSENGGAGDNWFWPNKSAQNSTAFEHKIWQSTTSVNTMMKQGAPFHLKIKKRWPRATFVVYDTHSLLLDILAKPKESFDAPANVKDVYKTCAVDDGQDCEIASEPLSSFMFYDELHPSERTSDIIAKHFIDVINGNSEYATYWT
ncbi:hypothetical protein ACJ41O_014652 [Fusarium nematophilum]